MKLTTKYDRGDKVFVVHKDEVVTAIVASITITINPISGEQTNKYTLKRDQPLSTFLNDVEEPKKFFEHKIYPTKNQLLKSL